MPTSNRENVSRRGHGNGRRHNGGRGRGSHATVTRRIKEDAVLWIVPCRIRQEEAHPTTTTTSGSASDCGRSPPLQHAVTFILIFNIPTNNNKIAVLLTITIPSPPACDWDIATRLGNTAFSRRPSSSGGVGGGAAPALTRDHLLVASLAIAANASSGVGDGANRTNLLPPLNVASPTAAIANFKLPGTTSTAATVNLSTQSMLCKQPAILQINQPLQQQQQLPFIRQQHPQCFDSRLPI